MKKCTLCIDRIYNETFEPEDRVPACVATCPASARHFGDLGDPNSAVSKLVAEREGYDLMPELGYCAHQQVSAAAAAASRRGCTGRRPGSSPRCPAARRPAGMARPAAVGMNNDRAGSVGATVHPSLSVIFFTTASAPATGCWRCSVSWRRLGLLPRGSAVRPGGAGPGARPPSPPVCCPRCSISARRSAPGGPSRSGGRRGCRARASPPSRPIVPGRALRHRLGIPRHRLEGRGRAGCTRLPSPRSTARR